MRRYFLLLTGAETAVGEMGNVHLALLPPSGPCGSWETAHRTVISLF